MSEETFLNIFDDNCRITKEYNKEGRKLIELRTKFKPESSEEETTKWIKNYSEVTKTKWIVKRNFKNPIKYVFKKDFVCQQSSKNKVNREVLKQGNNCTATISICVRINNANTRRIDKLMRLGLNTTIKIIGSHSHQVHAAEAYSYLSVNDETTSSFISYFENGLGPTESKVFHENNLIVNADENVILRILSDAQINPTDRQIHHIYGKWRAENYASRNMQSTADIIKKNMTRYEEQGVIMSVQESPITICLITPIMKRAHNYRFAAETVFVDSTTSYDESGATITLLVGGCKIGGIPLGCIIHRCQSEEDYFIAFNEIKKLIGATGFGGRGEPNVIMTSQSALERKALSKVFESSKLLLCPFHLCQAVWRWLWDRKHDILHSDRKPIILMVQQILYETDQVSCQELIDGALKSELLNEYPGFKEYFEALIQRKKEWSIAYRQDCLTRGQNTNNLVETYIRVLKDVVLKRWQAFNLNALTDFVIDTLENHHRRRLQKYASFRVAKPDFEFKNFCYRINNLKVKRVQDNLFHVSSAHEGNTVYTVHSELCLCECAAGITGAFCKHLCAVHMNFGMELSRSPSISLEDRWIFARIALGDNINDSFLQNMSEGSFPNENPETSLLVTEFQETMTEDEENNPNEIVTELQELTSEDEGNNQNETSESSGEDLEECQEMQRLATNFNRLIGIAKLNTDSYMRRSLRQFNNYLMTIKTPSQLIEFFQTLTKRNFRKKRANNVQSAVIPRRKVTYKESILKVRRPARYNRRGEKL